MVELEAIASSRPSFITIMPSIKPPAPNKPKAPEAIKADNAREKEVKVETPLSWV